jgi:hypothetical protein
VRWKRRLNIRVIKQTFHHRVSHAHTDRQTDRQLEDAASLNVGAGKGMARLNWPSEQACRLPWRYKAGRPPVHCCCYYCCCCYCLTDWLYVSKTQVTHTLHKHGTVTTRLHQVHVFTFLIMSLWVKEPCGLVGRSQRFGEAYCLHLQGWSYQLPSRSYPVHLSRPDWPFPSGLTSCQFTDGPSKSRLITSTPKMEAVRPHNPKEHHHCRRRRKNLKFHKFLYLP